MTEPIILETEDVRAVIESENGAYLSHLSMRTPIGWREILIPGSDPGCGAFPLVPYSGRIPNGDASNAGRAWQAPLHPRAGKHAMHGDGWKRPWSVLEIRDASVKLELDYPTEDWPFNHSVRMTLTCTANRFHLAFFVTNDDGIPFGLGWHPFFPMLGGARLEFDHNCIWRLQNDQFVKVSEASGAFVVLEPGFATRQFAVAGPDMLISWQDAAHRLRIEWTGVSHLVIYVHPDYQRFAIEPANHPVGTFNRSSDSTVSSCSAPLQGQLNLTLSLL